MYRFVQFQAGNGFFHDMRGSIDYIEINNETAIQPRNPQVTLHPHLLLSL